MAEFSHIKVTPAEEEDIVIQAGAVEEAAPASSDDAFITPETALEAAAAPEGERSAEARAQKAYRETTLEDLQHAGMSGLQKAIIAVAIAGVAAFIIWYVLLH